MLSVLCYGIAMMFGAIGFILAYIGVSFNELGDLINPEMENKPPGNDN